MGYYNHFEIGWVLEEYIQLMEIARNLEIKSPETYYNDGKIKGKSSRGQVIEGEKTSDNKVGTDLNKLAPESNACPLTGKPKLHELPDMIKRINVTEQPKLLNGFKFLIRN